MVRVITAMIEDVTQFAIRQKVRTELIFGVATPKISMDNCRGSSKYHPNVGFLESSSSRLLSLNLCVPPNPGMNSRA